MAFPYSIMVGSAMAAGYAEPDYEVVDYQIYCLDDEVRDRQTNNALLLRGPKPKILEKEAYFVCIGAAQTFGRFCEKPFPTILQEKLGIETLNLGRGGAGPSFFLGDNESLLHYINGARFAIVQIMSGRSEGNSLFDCKGLGHYTRLTDGALIGCDEAFRELIEKEDQNYVKQIVTETRQNWIDSYAKLLNSIHVPKILFWFAERKPQYNERYSDVYGLFGEFPQLVNFDMVKAIRKYSDDYVECMSRRGRPHLLYDRFTGKRTTVSDSWGGKWTENWYYPSPGMHEDAATALAAVCKKFLAPIY